MRLSGLTLLSLVTMLKLLTTFLKKVVMCLDITKALDG